MDTELFMECEEEELEPWQQVDDGVEEDEMDFYDNYEAEPPSPPPALETQPPRIPLPSTPAAAPAAVTPRPPLPPPPPPPPPGASSPAAGPPPPLLAQAPPLFLTQTAGGTFLLPATPGSGPAPPLLLTAQGFPVPAVVKPGAPLLLNLQGSTLQSLALIQAPPLGQLVRPGASVTPILHQAQAAPPHPGYMQLPAPLAICTPGSVNFQLPHVGGARALRLPGSPFQHAVSANGVSRAPPLFTSVASPSPSAVSALTSAPLLTSDPTKVVMSVEEFYYGTWEGDLSLRRPHPLGIRTSSYTCWTCSHPAENNLRLMQHMLQHSALVAAGNEKKCCRFCYRQISSPAQLLSHQEQVHGPAPSTCMCRICEWAFKNEPTFLNHMKANHKPGEMPYVCQVCSYRSSFYSDVLQHFASFHRDSRFLLCVFCLKVTRNPNSYQQHVLRHQVSQAFHCSRCRLQFIFQKDKTQHKLESHCSVRRPARLEGLPPGSKVTIRTLGKLKTPMTSAGSGVRLQQIPAPLVWPIHIKTEPETSPTGGTPPPPGPPRSPDGRGVTVDRSAPPAGGPLLCLECGSDASDLAAHYPTHVHCLLCRYSSCCSRAYAAHMIHHHVPRSKDQALPLHRRPPPCPLLVTCSQCDFKPASGDHMARHLLTHPEHRSAICCSRVHNEPDIQLWQAGFGRSPEEQDPFQEKDWAEVSWLKADCWKPPSDSGVEESSVLPFQLSSGPQHILSRTCDAIDYFHLLFPAALLELIASETNAHTKIRRYLGRGSPGWVPVTTHEVRAFIGLCVLMGTQSLADPSHYWSWNHYDNSYTFCRAMTYQRFRQIADNIRMGSFIADECRGTADPADPLHIFRPMLELLSEAMWDAYRPNCSLTIDRALLPSLDLAGSPQTPQVWLLCDSKSGFCHRFFIQVGGEADQEAGFTVVPQLLKGLEDKRHQVYLTSSLTSVPLVQKLLDRGIYASSSFPPPSHILPRALWEEGQLERPGHFLQRKLGPLMATRWRDSKEMGCLSTNAEPGETDTVWRRSQTKAGGLDPIDRPMAFRLLQENMRGVDICKQLLACNPLGGILQDRLWRRLFWFLVNLSIVNAFIVLRESRRENPPPWVQDGLFTQVNFRKRLGNQLARCERHCDTPEAVCSGSRPLAQEEPLKQRHRMAKISSISKRCKNCNLKNVRHESVYGCIICKANLCNQPCCFWEYHGLTAANRGSTKIGFVKNRLSGEVVVEEVSDQMDASMAPVEDLDFSDDDRFEDEDELDEEPEEEAEVVDKDPRQPASPPSSAATGRPPPDICAPREREDLLTARQLRIALHALCEGLRRASRIFATDGQTIRSWLKEASKHLEQEQNPQGDGWERMVAWVLAMREQQLPITESSLFHKASAVKKKGGFGDSFRISYDWAVGFMLRHGLGPPAVGREPVLASGLPPSLGDRIRTFRAFTRKVVRTHGLPGGAVAAMDELCLFVDWRLVPDRSRRAEALELTGSLPLLTVYLAALADGTMLPALVLTCRTLPETPLPDCVLLEAGHQSLTVEESLDLWTRRVWLPFAAGPGPPVKSLLVLDQHREHLGDPFLGAVGGCSTLPAVIPGGCSFHLQPLEVCVKPVLQRFLLSRWSAFVSKMPEELEETSPHRLQANIAKLLVEWVVEAMSHLKNLPQVWRKSFLLTGLLPHARDAPEKGDDQPEEKEGEGEGQKETEVQSQNLEKVQLDLLKTLKETLLGSRCLQEDPFDLLEMEEDKASEEEEEMAEREDGEEQDAEDNEMEINNAGRKSGEEEEMMKEESDAEEGEDMALGQVKVKELLEVEVATEVEENEMKLLEDREKEESSQKKVEEDSDEERGKETEEDHEVSKERRETRIVIGEELGDEWKMTVKSRPEGPEVEENLSAFRPAMRGGSEPGFQSRPA